MKKYNVTGMSCAACSARVEKAVSKVLGVTSCSVNLLLGSLSVEGDVSDADIISAVVGAGYGATAENKKSAKAEAPTKLQNNETATFMGRLISSLVLLAVLMYVSMGHVMWGWYLPPMLSGNPITLALIELLLTTAVMVINQKFFVNGFKGLIKLAPNMDTLVALGSAAAYIYSLYMLFKMSADMLVGDITAAFHCLHGLYFESAAMILTLISVGKMLESYSKGKTTSALEGLINLAPKTATVIRDGKEVTILASELSVGDEFVVRPGESIPADATVISGSSAVNEAALTGESVPAEKAEGSKVYAATVNTSGHLKCKAIKVGEDTTLSEIIRMVSDASSSKAPIARLADKVSGVFVPTVIAIALVTVLAWLIIGEGIGFAIARGISVLVISCPCALGLATPVAIMVGNGVAAKAGILFKTATALEVAGKVKTVVLDKTGTVTEGKPKVTDIILNEDVPESELLSVAAALESKSEHPLSRAIMEYCRDITPSEVTDFLSVSGSGLTAKLNGVAVFGGNAEYINKSAQIPKRLLESAEELSAKGKTPLYFAKKDSVLGIIAVADVIKQDSEPAIKQLKAMGIDVIMLTGDNERTAKNIAAKAGIDKVIAGVMPQEKLNVIAKLCNSGKVAMVGDGINDAPALTRADVGIAIGAGTDIAIDAADIVLVKSKLYDVVESISVSRATLRNIKQNLFWAFIYNIIGIPLAAGVFINLFGWQLNPMFAAAAMSLSSFCVVTNALRLNLFKTKNNKKEKKRMQKTVKIEGMMCPHCEARVKELFEAMIEVESAEVSHKTGTATLTLNADLTDEVIKTAIENAGYKII